MLNTFPTLLYFGIIIPFIFRLILSYFYFKKAYKELYLERKNKKSKERYFAILESFLALFLLVGFYTQITSLILIVSTIFYILLKKGEFEKYEKDFYLLLLIILISFLFLGAGIFAFDLPL